MSQLEALPAHDLLSWAVAQFGSSFAIATAFQKEGMVIIDLAVRIDPRIRVFTLDTGRLPAETLQMVDTVRERYGISVEVVEPDAAEVEQMVSIHGLNLFRDSVERREQCCEVRKVRPLERKLAGLQAWATGLRRGQSAARVDIPKVQMLDGRLKLNPLADWTAGQVEEYIERERVPVHPLYAQGYGSIGCAPCTRAVAPGDDPRSGRWWWEQESPKECGIHIAADGSVERLKHA